MSRNFTDGGERPFLVLIDALEERMDLAGSGFDAVDETEGERARPLMRCRSAVSPKIATWRSHEELFAQNSSTSSSSSDVLLPDPCRLKAGGDATNGISGSRSLIRTDWAIDVREAKGSLSGGGKEEEAG